MSNPVCPECGHYDEWHVDGQCRAFGCITCDVSPVKGDLVELFTEDKEKCPECGHLDIAHFSGKCHAAGCNGPCSQTDTKAETKDPFALTEEELEAMTEEELQEMISEMEKRREDKKKNKDKNKDKKDSGIHCARCGATEAAVKLTGVTSAGATIDVRSPAASRIECWDLNECKKRGGKGDYSTSYPGFNTTTYIQKCRHEPTKAFSIADITFYGGSESKVVDLSYDPKEWLVVSLLGMPASSKLWAREQSWLNWLRPYTMTPHVTIDWSDMQAPPVKPGFWNRLVALAKKNKIPKILFYCIGGHGRTGTALSSVLVECVNVLPTDAVEFIRKVYCKEAVETQSQVKYLGALYDFHNPVVEEVATNQTTAAAKTEPAKGETK